MNKQIKKILQALLLTGLVAALVLSLGACGKKKDSKDKNPSKATTQATKATKTTKPTTVPTTAPTTAPTTDPSAETTESTGPVCEHTKAAMKVDKEATCQENGSQHKECPDCGYKGPAETIEKIGHINSDWIVEKEATCIAEGKQYVQCTMCKKRLANVGIPKTDHTPGEWILDQAPTSAEPGKTHQECDVCKTVLDTAEIPATGSAGLTFAKNSDGKTYKVTGVGTCKDTVIYIPDTYEGLQVTAIGDQAFAGCSQVERIVLPDTITEIGNRAFYASGLKEFTIPASVKTLGTQIFFQADNLDTVYYNSDYANQTTSIFGATSVKKVAFGGTKVPDNVCQGAAELTEVVIADTVDEIGYYSFEDCTSLYRAEIPSSVGLIGPGAFKNCTSLATLVIPDSVSVIDAQTFEGCTALTSVEIPDSVIRINSRAFAGCSSLFQVTVPVSITNIGEEAFRDCVLLQTIEFMGAQTQWDKIPKGANWDWNTGNYIVIANG